MILPSLSIVPYAHNRAGSMFTQLPLNGGFTVSSSDQGTIVNADGIIERSPRNLCINTQTFTAASWAQTSSPTIADNAEIAPDGTMTAAVMTDGQIQYAAGIGVIGKQYTCSMYIRRISGTGTVRFRAIENINTNIIVTSEWQRFSLTVAATTATLRIGINLQSGTSTVAIWGAQIEESLTPTPYQRIDASRLNFPRIDWLGQSCPALLVEASGQNLALQSEAFDTSPWSAQFSATVSANTAISPDGTQNADTINLATDFDSRVRQAITPNNLTTYTISCFYKNIALTAGQTFRMRFNHGLFIATATIDLAAGTATYNLTGTPGTGYSGTATGRVDNYGNGWYRVSLTFTTGSGVSSIVGLFEAANNSSGAACSFYAWGAQLETGSVATSYIPTTTAAVTRAADIISASGVSGLIGQTEGTMYAEVDAVSGINTSRLLSVTESGIPTNNRVIFNIASLHRLEVIVRSNNTNTNGSISPSAATLLANGINKIAYAYNNVAGSYALAINGSVVATSTGTFAFTQALSLVNVARSEIDLTIATNQRIRSAALYTTRLDNYDLMAMTSLDTSYEQLAARLSYAT